MNHIVSEETALIYGVINGSFGLSLLLIGWLHLKRNDAAAGRIVAILGLSEILRSVWYFLLGWTGNRLRLLNRFAMLMQFLGMSFVAVWFAAIRRELYFRTERNDDTDRKLERRYAVAFVIIHLILWVFTLATSMIHNTIVYELNLVAIVLCFIIVSIGLLLVSRRLTIQVSQLEYTQLPGEDRGREGSPRPAVHLRRQLFRCKVIACSFLITIFFGCRVFAIIFHITKFGFRHDKGLGTTPWERRFLFPWFYYTIPELFANVVLVFLTAPKDSSLNIDDDLLLPIVAWYHTPRRPTLPKSASDAPAIKQRLGLHPDRTDYDIM